MTMTESELDRWLFENGGPAIRYRTATELLPRPAAEDVRRLRADLLASPFVKTWLARLQPDFSFNALHGAKPACFENTLGKLAQLGCHAGMPALDDKVSPFLDWLADRESAGEAGFVQRAYSQTIVAAFLACAGYGESQPVAAVAQRRLDTLYEFCRRGSYDIYVAPIYVDPDSQSSAYPAVPAAYRRYRLIDPALYVDGDMCLPALYDLHLLSSLPPNLRNPDSERKLDTIIDYVMQAEYQRLPEGYGILLHGKGRYWVMGWSVHLPGYFGVPLHSGDPMMRRLVRMAVLMAHFAAARRHPWLQDTLARLDAFRTERNTHRFPAHFLHEGSSGYWLMGSYMALEENRRRKIALELESMFWMRKLVALCGI